MTAIPKEHSPSGFCLVRTPLLPVDDFVRWSQSPAEPEDRVRTLKEQLSRTFQTLVAKEALFIASPDLLSRLMDATNDEESRRSKRVFFALARYFGRMATRPTPFGLFSGCTVGRVGGSETVLTLSGRSDYERCSRLDFDVVAAIAMAITRRPDVQPYIPLRINTSLYRSGSTIRYFERSYAPSKHSQRLISVQRRNYLDAALLRASHGALPRDIADSVRDTDASLNLEECAEFVRDLVNSQILVPVIEPELTGREPLSSVIDQLAAIGIGETTIEPLRRLRSEIERLNTLSLGAPVEHYERIQLMASLQLESEGGNDKSKNTVRVDLLKPSNAMQIGEEVAGAVLDGVGILHRFWSPQVSSLSRFREQFQSRYADREVPLVEALDDESGLGFENSDQNSRDYVPLIRELHLRSRNDTRDVHWSLREQLMLEKLQEARNDRDQEIIIDDRDIRRLSDRSLPPLPNAFAALVTLGRRDRGEFNIVLHSASGPSGVPLMGRFCHSDSNLEACVYSHIKAEEALESECLFAEIVHHPTGIGGVVARPILRDYEIPYLGKSGTTRERQLLATDLLISVVGEEIVLRLSATGQRVIPRMTNAHNFRPAIHPPVYRFLAALQRQGVADELAWSWTPFNEVAFLPRVRYKNVVLSRAVWLLKPDDDDVRTIRDAREHRAKVDSVLAAANSRRMPQYLCFVEGDNEMTVDLENELSVEMLADVLQRRGYGRICEMLPLPDDAPVEGPEGRFTNEIIIPFVRASPVRNLPLTPKISPAARRTFAPCSEFLYLKLYCGSSTADRILTGALPPTTAALIRRQMIDRWFFLRYRDPETHLRVRLRLTPGTSYGSVVDELKRFIDEVVAAGHTWRAQFDTYEREVERYGGEAAIDSVESLFWTDSIASTVLIRESLAGGGDDEGRWRMAILGLDALMNDFGLDTSQKLALTIKLRAALGGEFVLDRRSKDGLAALARLQRVQVDSLLCRPESGSEAVRIALLERSESARSPIEILRTLERDDVLTVRILDIVSSLMHMHVNRVLRSSHRAQELVLYDLLQRCYGSAAAKIQTQ